MKCLMCPNEIDENKDFRVKGPQGQDLDDIVGRLRHVEDLSHWTHLTLTAQYSYTQVLLSGHVCPSHRIEPGRIGLMEVAISAPKSNPSPVPATLPSSPAPLIRRKEQS